MASILSHPAVPLAIALGLGPKIISPRLLLAAVVVSIVPDVDVYLQQITSSIGHRGITHTVLFALLCAVFAVAIARPLQTRRVTAFWFIAVTAISHGLLDALTNGGAGIPFFWPLSDERYFLPWRVVEVSPMGIVRFFSDRGVSVLISESKWIWLPAGVLGLALHWSCGSRTAAAR